MKHNLICGLLCLALVMNIASAAGIRDHTRPAHSRTTKVNQTQAQALTLTLVTVTKQKLQTWLRLAATLKRTKQHQTTILNAKLCSKNSNLIKVGQRVRVFSPDSKSSIYQARVSNIRFKNNCANINAKLATIPADNTTRFVIEVVIERGQKMAIAKEAIIEEGNSQIVYRKIKNGEYQPVAIQTGIKGELYTEILLQQKSQLNNGLKHGDQVVTLGSFFIDAEFKLKSATTSGTGHAHLHH
ncbi:hypothetical protein MNBD_GAMMA22-189 [hydrothermal vent metagenome]|uniref:RND efflux pump membrane fusion protein barrel-sandwich domain-containing protein n=1 Tax=hydrothermal vent metagenome TaxID=652676 RepID=A0A3B1B6G1_9ZZZZ